MTAEKSITPYSELRNNIKRLESEFKAALPSQIPVERFTRVLLTEIQMNPDLLSADRNTLYAAAMKAAADGLVVDRREAALVIFKTKAGPIVVYIPMISGILKKAHQSGQIKSISLKVIHQNDHFRYHTDSFGDHLEFQPSIFSEDRGDWIGAFALVVTKDEGHYIEVMTKAQILAVKNVSKSKEFGPWSGPFEDQMWLKTVFKRLAKRLPTTIDIADLIDREEQIDVTHEPAALPPPKTSSGRLERALAESIATPQDEITEDDLNFDKPPKELAT